MKNKNKDIKTKENTNKKKERLISYLVGFGIVLVIAGIILAVVLLNKNKDGDEEIIRFEDVTHITLKQFNALIGKSEADDDFGDLDSSYKSAGELFIFIYNPNYDDCEDCEELESLIINKARDNEYTILVMNYNENLEISELYDSLQLPDRPALIHIKGEEEITEDNIFINIKAIQTALADLN